MAQTESQNARVTARAMSQKTMSRIVEQLLSRIGQ